MRVHIVNAHLTYPNWSEGTLNHAMAEKAKAHLGARGHDVTETVVEESFDPEVEVRRHLDADLVVLQTSRVIHRVVRKNSSPRTAVMVVSNVSSGRR